MIEDGLFERFPMKSVWGLHNWPGLPLGTAVAHSGTAMAGNDIFTLIITGVGGHAAMPHQTYDPIVAIGLCIVSLQNLVARQADPFDQVVLSLTKIAAGSAFNVIPSTGFISGTLRTMQADTRQKFLEKIADTAKHAAASGGCKVQMEIHGGYPPTINDANKAADANQAAKIVLGKDAIVGHVAPSMAAEDFAFMLQKKPGAYIWLGAGADSEKLHSPYFDFNDALLPLGVNYWLQVVKTQLAAD
jgi:hippurate hydrolase